MASGPLVAALLLAAAAGAGEPAPLRVRASEAAAPCVEAAAAAYGKPVEVEAGPLRDATAADVFVASSGVEMTRVLESGRAEEAGAVDVARIPWVLSVARGNPEGIATLKDLARPGLDAVMLAGPAAYQARQAVSAVAPAKLRETADREALRSARVALVPLSLAGAGEHIPVDVPALEARAAVAKGTPREEEATAFVRFLGSEKGQRAFAGCAPPAP
jgi:molybdate transport system substrate-binding protein